MGERAFGRQPAFDQPVRCVGLNDASIATAASIARADRDDDLETGGNDVEPFSSVFANLHHVGAAAGTDLLRGFDHLFDARQMVGQMAKVALGGRASDFAISITFDQRLTRGLGFRDGRFQIFKGQLALVGRQLLGPLAIKRMAQFGDQVILTFGMGFQELLSSLVSKRSSCGGLILG